MPGSLFDAMCQPFIWGEASSQDGDEPELKPVSGPLLFDKRWMDEVPSLMLSDTEDDSSLPEYPPPRKTSIHEVVETKDCPTDLNRHVRFGEAHIREHPMIPGGCCDALPLSLDWGFQDERVYDIDDYETMREQSGRKERGKVARIDHKVRKRILATSAEESKTSEETRGSDRFSPVGFGDQNGEAEYEETSFPNDISSPGCNPFEAMQGSAWGMFGYNGTYPSMTVQILED